MAIAIDRTEYRPKVDVKFVSHIYNQTVHPVGSDHQPSSLLVLYDLFIVSPADSGGSYSLTDRQRGSAVALGQVELPRRVARFHVDDGSQASLTGERALASIERASDDLQEKVEQFEEREDALRERFQEAMT